MFNFLRKFQPLNRVENKSLTVDFIKTRHEIKRAEQSDSMVTLLSAESY